MKILLQLIFLALAQFYPLAYATPIQPRFYAGAELGIPFGTEQENSLSQALVSRLGGNATVTEAGMAQNGRIFGGYKALENMDFEIGLFQTTESTYPFTGRTGLGIPYSGNARTSVYGINYVTLLRPNIASGWHHVFVRLGGHWSRMETTSTIAGLGSSTTTNSGSGSTYGFGYEGIIDTTINWRLQLTRTNRLGGKSGSNASVISLGILKNF